MKVLVTGGAGFIGSHLVNLLVEQNMQVMVVDNLSTGLRENVNSRAWLVELDVLSPELLRVFAEARFDAVIHLAAQTGVPYSLERPDIDCQLNIDGMVNVLEACRKTGVGRIIFSSSAAVYGDVSVLPVTEDITAVPTSFYGLSKLTAEKYMALYKQIHELNYAVLRFANVYGERQGDRGEGGVVSIFARKLAKGQPVAIFGDGGQTRDFIYVGDVAAAILQAILAPVANLNRIFNISTKTQTSVLALLELLEQAAGITVDKKNAPARDGDIYHSLLANEVAVKALAWQPKMNLAAGLARTYRALRHG